MKTVHQLKALSDETRLRIIHLLADRELCVCDLIEGLKESQPKISRHLNVLRRSRIVTERKAGLWRHYRLSAEARENPLLGAVRGRLQEEPVCMADDQALETWLAAKSRQKC